MMASRMDSGASALAEIKLSLTSVCWGLKLKEWSKKGRAVLHTHLLLSSLPSLPLFYLKCRGIAGELKAMSEGIRTVTGVAIETRNSIHVQSTWEIRAA